MNGLRDVQQAVENIRTGTAEGRDFILCRLPSTRG
jgi:hypothetical protein